MYKSRCTLFVYFVIFLCSVQDISTRSIQESGANHTCGYDACHPIKEGYINVHLIPHSHDDVGWVKTLDQFFYGTKPEIYRASVQIIYDNVLKSVQRNKDRRFIYVETAFFWKWWQLQEDSERNALRELVNNGRIEFIGGGWSMNDEAVTNYQSIIDQMSWGLRKLNDCFGECGRPKVGWQIDPFGHSSEMASIFAQLGFDGVILGRIDFQDKNARLANKSMDMVWRGSNNLGRKTDIFTSVLYKHYDAPAGFCFDVLCEFETLVDDPNSPEYNIDEKAEAFISIINTQDAVNSYQSNNVIVPMGRDFAYQEPETWFTNMDRLIKYVNSKEIFNNTKYHLLYSTPSCYTAAVKKETKGILTSPLKVDDFFPYATDEHAFWTGFYTSRPTLKRFERIGNNFLQICKQLYALTNTPSSYVSKLDTLREAMGVMQHHDAITGTEREKVAHDYARMLHIGISNCENITSQALSTLTVSKDTKFETCLLTNVSQCALTENTDTFVVTVYNPLSHLVNKYVRLPVFGKSYSIIDPDGNTVPNQIIPIALGVQNVIGRNSNATLELVFEAQNLPPLGFKSFYVQKQQGDSVTQEDLTLNFKYSNKQDVGFNIDPSTGLVNKMQINNIYLDVDQRFWAYNGSNAWEDFNYKASGAYIFRPDELHPIAKISDTAPFEVYRGDLVTEVHQTFNNFVSQVVRVYENEKHVEFDWVVGPIEIGESWPTNGKEVISRFSTALETASTFYTDSNGREMLKRLRNFRPTWDIAINETESSNYYPVTSKITIRDEKNEMEFAVLTDRAQGGSSLEDGEVELMVMRNTITDDQLGMSEPLLETAFNKPIVIRGSHYVTFGHIKGGEESVAAIEREIASRKLLDSWIFLSFPTEGSYEEYKASHSMQFSGIKNALPKNVHIMTLEPWTPTSYLLRLEHDFEKGLVPILSQPVTVDLKDLFTTFEIKSLKETTLGGNQWLEDNERLGFKSAFQDDDLEFITRAKDSTTNFSVELQPMEIRTFIIEIVPNLH